MSESNAFMAFFVTWSVICYLFGVWTGKVGNR